MHYEGYAMETCEYCGRRFMDDCGADFCSERCERQYENEHATCDHCNDSVGEDNLTCGLCECCYSELVADDE